MYICTVNKFCICNWKNFENNLLTSDHLSLKHRNHLNLYKWPFNSQDPTSNFLKNKIFIQKVHLQCEYIEYIEIIAFYVKINVKMLVNY